ncbi:MAG: hypothetical protein JW849_04750 [Phycisphaerae bacterium]|nr:hypothetical protein [Phycisphaerae bacterium]
MTNGAAAGAASASGAAVAAAAIAQAIRASGAIVRVQPPDFLSVLARASQPVVVVATGGFWSKSYQYLTSYKGLAFYTKSPLPLNLPLDIDLVEAKKIWIP